MKITTIARQVGIDRKTVRKYIGRGIEVPTYRPRQPRERLLDPHLEYLRARLEAYKRWLVSFPPGGYDLALARQHPEQGLTRK